MMRLIVQYTELSWCHPVYRFVGMNGIYSTFLCFQYGMMELWGMTDLETDILSIDRSCQQMQVMDPELLLVCRLRIIAFADIQDILLHVLLHDKPRTTAEAQTVTLSDSVKP